MRFPFKIFLHPHFKPHKSDLPRWNLFEKLVESPWAHYLSYFSSKKFLIFLFLPIICYFRWLIHLYFLLKELWRRIKDPHYADKHLQAIQRAYMAVAEMKYRKDLTKLIGKEAASQVKFVWEIPIDPSQAKNIDSKHKPFLPNFDPNIVDARDLELHKIKPKSKKKGKNIPK